MATTDAHTAASRAVPSTYPVGQGAHRTEGRRERRPRHDGRSLPMPDVLDPGPTQVLRARSGPGCGVASHRRSVSLLASVAGVPGPPFETVSSLRIRPLLTHPTGLTPHRWTMPLHTDVHGFRWPAAGGVESRGGISRWGVRLAPGVLAQLAADISAGRAVALACVGMQRRLTTISGRD